MFNLKSLPDALTPSFAVDYVEGTRNASVIVVLET